jgi:ankyrin repeat protein
MEYEWAVALIITLGCILATVFWRPEQPVDTASDAKAVEEAEAAARKKFAQAQEKSRARRERLAAARDLWNAKGTVPSMHHAAGVGDIAALEYWLLEQGKDVNTQIDYFGDRAPSLLHLAAAHGEIDTIEMLVDLGADVIAQIPPRLDSVLHAAASQGQVKAMECLTAHGADVMAVDADNSTLLHYTAMHGHAAAARWLLGQGVDHSLLNDMNFTALAWAQKNSHHEAAAVLLEAAATSSRSV